MDTNLIFFNDQQPDQKAGIAKYKTLRQEQNDLRRRLSTEEEPLSRTSSVSSESSSNSQQSSTSSCLSLATFISRRRDSSESSSPDAQRLIDVDNQIKFTLTELLNCHAGKKDAGYRTWIQSRLMDTQMELKERRRRRSEEASLSGNRAL